MVEAAIRTMTLNEFLIWDDGTDRRYELIDGVPVAMAPPVPRHSRLMIRIGSLLETALRTPCQCFGEAGIVLPHRAHSFYVADLAVTCKAEDLDEQYLTQPRVIIEILSPTTTRHDLLRKVPDYQQVPSVGEIALVHAAERRIELWSRLEGLWHLEELRGDAKMLLASLGITLDLAAIYDGVVD